MTETNQNPLSPIPDENISVSGLQQTTPLLPIVEAIDVASTQTDWYNLAQSLHRQNQDLRQTIVQLEQSLADAQQNLQVQTRRVRHAEMSIDRQTGEVNQAREQIDRLVSELEFSQQTIQQQQNIINHLSGQLETTQGQLAQLERECVLLQEDKTGKTHQLYIADKHMRELQARLHRQQRYTLQYKSALEQYVDSPVVEDETSSSAKVIPLIPKNASIQSWTNVQNELESQTKDSMEAWVEPSPQEDIIPETAIASDANLEVSESEIEEPLAELEDRQPDLPTENNPPRQNWSFSIVPSHPAWKKTPTKSVDLPTFIREQPL